MEHVFWINGKNLDPDQTKAATTIPHAESFLLRGPAGSGKTNILLLRAKALVFMKKSNIKIIVFTSSLRDFLREGCVQYGIPPEIVVTGMQFFKEFLLENSVSCDLSGQFEPDRLLLAGEANALIKAKGISNTYDALLIDEAQDYMDTELKVFRALAERLVLAADSRQSIYRIEQTEGLLEELVDGKVVSLKYHYRSGLHLCKVADAILKSSAGYPPIKGECKYKEDERPSSVNLTGCPTFQDQISVILDKLKEQVALYPGERIGVLFPKNDQLKLFLDAFEYTKIPNKNLIWIDTLHGGKGWEFSAVHIGGCEALNKMGPVQKRLIYTGVLRGRTSASLYFTGSVPGYLDSALAILSPPVPAPTLDQLLGG